MASNSEKGHAKNLESIKKARDYATSWGAKYAPTNPILALTYINNLIENAERVSGELRAVKPPYTNAVNEAQEAFDPLSKLTTKLVKAFKVSGVPAAAVDDAKTFARKIQGKRKSPARRDDPLTPDVDESQEAHSASQMSRTQRIENLDGLIQLFKSHAIYNPNETELKTSSVEAYSAGLKEKTQAVNDTYVPVSNKLGERDEIYYSEQTGLVAIGRLFKEYVETFGRDSVEWRQIKGLTFTKIGRKK